MRVGVHVEQAKGLAKTHETNNVQGKKLELVCKVKRPVYAVVGVRVN